MPPKINSLYYQGNVFSNIKEKQNVDPLRFSHAQKQYAFRENVTNTLIDTSYNNINNNLGKTIFSDYSHKDYKSPSISSSFTQIQEKPSNTNYLLLGLLSLLIL